MSTGGRSVRKRSAPQEIRWRVEVPLFKVQEVVLWVVLMGLMGMMPLGLIAALELGSGVRGVMRAMNAVGPFIGGMIGLCVFLFLLLVYGVLRNRRVAEYTLNSEGIRIVYSIARGRGQEELFEQFLNFLGLCPGEQFIPWKQIMRWESDVVRWRIYLQVKGRGRVVVAGTQAIYKEVMAAIDYWLQVVE
ncbi:MAG: hypothetical protein NZM04_04600 [Methylacidiphilales bacterium]|nr:hypothetical protein [Candidatus Methylacidiphilales bacterium]MDW8350091.1 hypothetical protein [Verrucomicrobiae bacterium]